MATLTYPYLNPAAAVNRANALLAKRGAARATYYVTYRPAATRPCYRLTAAVALGEAVYATVSGPYVIPNP